MIPKRILTALVIGATICILGGFMFGCSSTAKTYRSDAEAILNRPVIPVSEASKTMGEKGRAYPEWNEPIQEKHLQGLPPVVQNYLKQTGVIGKKMARTIRLHQTGGFRNSNDQKWMKTKAIQVYNIDSQEFVWFADVKMNPVMGFKGRDRLFEGKGAMTIKLMDIFKVVDARGEKINQGSRMRLLNEMMWFPTAYLHPSISWEAIDEYSARVTMNFGDVTESAIITFDEQNRVANFIADRYMDRGNEPATLEKWETPITEYGTINGLSLPISGYAVWKLEKEEDFKYVYLNITDIKRNASEPGNMR